MHEDESENERESWVAKKNMIEGLIFEMWAI